MGNGLAVAGLVLGIIGVLAGLIPILFLLAWVLGVLALVFGLIGTANARRRGSGKGMAIAGAILGVVAVALGVVGIIIVNNVFTSTRRAIGHTSLPNSPNAPSAQVPASTQVPGTGATKLDIRTIDFRNHQYTLNCGEPNQTITLSDGMWQDPRGAPYGAVIGINVQYGDATGAGGVDAVVEVDCSFGAGSSISNVLVYAVRGDAATQVGQLQGSKPLLVGPGEIAIWNPRYQPNEPRCCPSQFERAVYQYAGRSFVPVETTVHTTAEFQAAPG